MTPRAEHRHPIRMHSPDQNPSDAFAKQGSASKGAKSAFPGETNQVHGSQSSSAQGGPRKQDGPSKQDDAAEPAGSQGSSPGWRSLTRAERWGLLALLLLAFGLRLWNVHAMQANPRFNEPVMDGAYHYDWAQAIVAGESFQEDAYFRAPLYPWMMAAVLKVSGGSLFAIRLLQCLLGTLTVWLVWRIGRRTFGPPTGWAAGFLAATYWILVYFDGEFLIPTLYVPLLLLALDATLRLEARGYAPKACAIAGLWYGLAAIARPNVLLFMPVLFFWVLARRPGERGWRGKALAGAALTIGTLIPIVPITVRNLVVSGEPVLIATQAGVNFWIGNHPNSDGMTALVPGTRAGWWEGYEDSRRMARQEAGRDLSSAQISKHYANKTWRSMAEQPWEAIKHLAWKTRLFWMGWETSNNQEIRFISHRFNPLSRWSINFATLLGLGAVGLGLALFRKRRETFPLWSFLLVYSGSVIAFFVCSRFRVPILPILILFAGFALVEGWRWGRARRWKPLGAALLAASTVTFLSSRLPDRLLTDDSLGYLALGSHALGEGDLDKAEEFLALGLEESQTNRHLRFVWGLLLEERGQLDAARLWWYESLAMYPDYPELRGRLAKLENDTGNFAEAKGLADAGLTTATTQVPLLLQRAIALYGLGQKPQAVAGFEEVLELEESHPMAHVSRVQTLVELQRLAEARAAWQAGAPHLLEGPEALQQRWQTLRQVLGIP